jgi:hypothetical protein
MGKRGKKMRRDADGSRFLREARKHPGVEALARIYDSWRAISVAAEPYASAMNGEPVLTASDSSRPAIW